MSAFVTTRTAPGLGSVGWDLFDIFSARHQDQWSSSCRRPIRADVAAHVLTHVFIWSTHCSREVVSGLQPIPLAPCQLSTSASMVPDAVETTSCIRCWQELEMHYIARIPHLLRWLERWTLELRTPFHAGEALVLHALHCTAPARHSQQTV